ncbi:MAG: hypothetical protein R3F34_00400 [Planctomycetota bacterium]
MYRTAALLPARLARGARPVGVVLASLAITVPALAAAPQGERFLVSTTSDVGAVDAALPLLDDADLVTVGGGALPEPWFMAGQWRALTDFVPADVDGLATRWGEPRAGDLYFSFLSDEGGFRDGDVVLLDADGSFRVAIPEADVAAALGDASLVIDLDGIAFDDQGRLVFSLQDDVDSPTLGAIANGDVLMLDGVGGAVRLFTEQEATDALALATGSSSAVGDVQGLEWVNGEVWVAIQSPSAFDGAVLALGPLARIVADENEIALGGDEIDALVHLGAHRPLSLWFETQAGTYSGRVAVQGAAPGAPVLVVASGGVGYVPTPYLGGFGGFALDPLDPMLTVLLGGAGPPIVWSDGTGRFEGGVALTGAFALTGHDGAPGMTFQAVDLVALTQSAPFRVEP